MKSKTKPVVPQVKVDSLEESIKDVISKAITDKVNALTDEKIQELLLPIVEKEFKEKIAPVIEASIKERTDHYMSNVKEIVRETMKELFNP